MDRKRVSCQPQDRGANAQSKGPVNEIDEIQDERGKGTSHKLPLLPCEPFSVYTRLLGFYSTY